MRALDAPGYDLLALMIGSEGLLAVVTEVTVKLMPKPETAQVIMASFDDVGRAGDAVAAIIARRHHSGRAGDDGQGDHGRRRALRPGRLRPRRRGHPALRIRRHGGRSGRGNRPHARGAGRQRRHGPRASRATRPSGCKFWAGRKAAFPAAGRISPDYYCMDGTIPRKRLGEMLRAIADMEQKYGLRCINVFHAGDGNLHPLILYDANVPGELERTEAFGAEILELSVDARRHHHRRAWRRPREDRRHVRAVRRRRTGGLPSRSRRPSIRRAC